MSDSKHNALDDAVVVALGSSLPGQYPSSRDLLEAALRQFRREGLYVTERSRLWRSAAWPDASNPVYLNGVALVEPRLSPRETMNALLRLEQAFGRERRAPNGPRTLDLDLIAHGRVKIDEPGLIVPHPRAHLRRFVMGPLAEIAPLWTHPNSGQTARALAATSAIGLDATPCDPP